MTHFFAQPNVPPADDYEGWLL